MSYYDQHQAPAPVYPPPSSAYPPTEQSNPPAYVVAPPPAGYPTKDGAAYPQQVPVETKDRSDGFWKGCCAALCCCCVLDMCF
ncbi:protein CYSTEINE-RICH TRANSMEMBRANE MODULE 9-like [Typha angustifolia]|uniref:protein CYSTEINE-RICH TRANSMEMBRANE MODULE 9-like n=1 Tax=Typha angustifolia TaxID=59011 RepID=UPI003C2BE2C5